MDQADKLRDMISQRRGNDYLKHTLDARVIAVTSGKGGVGKTNFAINLAIQMRKLNKRVILIDTDFGLANIEVLFGVNPKYNFGDVLSGLVDVETALMNGPMDIPFLSGGSGITAMSNINERQMNVLIDSFAQLDSMTDVIIIDTGAGVTRSVINFIRASKETILITTPDPTSVTDAYALVKTVRETTRELPVFKLVVNRVENPNEGADISEKLSRVCSRFLGIKLSSLGNIPNDPYLSRAVKRQQPVSLLYPNAESSRCIEAIATNLLHMPAVQKPAGLRAFVQKLVGVMSGSGG